jgi:hypothetical protein
MTLTVNHTGKWLARLLARGIWSFDLVMLLVVSSICSANEVEKLSVTHAHGEYRLEIVSVLDVPAEYAYEVITDYQHTYRINPSIVETEVSPTEREGVVRVHNRSEHYVGPFSFHIDWTGHISSPNPGEIEISTVPEDSSFESGHAVWRIRPRGERTLVKYTSSLKPKFFVPPIIGDKIMEDRIRRDTLATFRRIECNARLMFELDFEQAPEDLRNLFAQRDDCVKLDS